jgi:hypothetical protein
VVVVEDAAVVVVVAAAVVVVALLSGMPQNVSMVKGWMVVMDNRGRT